MWFSNMNYSTLVSTSAQDMSINVSRRNISGVLALSLGSFI
jgi:hypothetical protein